MLAGRIVQRLDCDDRALFGKRASVVGIVCNVLLAVTKAVVGIVSGSVSVVADALNNLMDSISSVVSLVGFKMATKPADKHHPYGHGRFEYVAGLVMAMLIVVVGVDLVRSSFERILNPAPTHHTVVTLALLAASIALKLWLMRFYFLAAKHIGSKTLEAAAHDSRNDVLATSAVLAGALISSVCGINLDGWLGLCVGAFVVVSSIGIMRETVNPLLGSEPDPELVERVQSKILSYPGVLGTHDLLIHDYGPGRRIASAHVEMSSDADPLDTHKTIDQIEQDLQQSEGLLITLHYDPIRPANPKRPNTRVRLEDAVRRVDERLAIHDLRVLPGKGEDSRVLSFDCVVPPELTIDSDELAAAIQQEVDATMPGSECSIVFDRGYIASVE